MAYLLATVTVGTLLGTLASVSGRVPALVWTLAVVLTVTVALDVLADIHQGTAILPSLRGSGTTAIATLLVVALAYWLTQATPIVTGAIGPIVTGWYLAHAAVQLVASAGRLGLPLPPQIAQALGLPAPQSEPAIEPSTHKEMP